MSIAPPATAHHHHHDAHEHHHGAGHDHAHHHGVIKAPTTTGFSLLALSAPTRLALALPPIAGLWLLTAWALGNG